MANQEQIETLRESLDVLIEEQDFARAAELLSGLHPADQADVIEDQDEEHARALVQALSPDQLGEVLEYLNEEMRASLIQNIPAETLASALDELDEDVAADIVQDLPREQAEEVVPLLEYRDSIAELLIYPEESAGGRMSVDFVAVQRRWTVDEAIQFLRNEAPDDNHPFYLYVVDDEGRLTGTVSLRSLVTAAPETPIAAITSEDLITVQANEDQEVVAERMRHYNLLALPVVDAAGKLRGVITADDVLDVQVQEATEDFNRLVGLPEEERIFRPIREAVPPRLAWLMINLFTALMAAATVSIFEGTIERVAVLAVFMPVVAGMGGNAGIQTITLVVRSIALGEIGPRDAKDVLRHEAIIAVIKGVVIGVVVGVIALVWHGNAWLGLIVAVAMLANIVNATLAGVMVPLVLKRLRLDPALASGVMVTTFSDVVGFFVFLGLGAIFVDQLT